MSEIGAAILIVGAIVSYLQWRTAQQKVALDIIETRFEIYQDLRTAVSNYLTTAEFTLDDQRHFMAAQSRARFYFGGEVADYLERIRRDINTAHLFDRYAARPAANVDEQIARLDRINSFYSEIDRMFIPYMRLNQRMPLWWWPSIWSEAKRFLMLLKRLLFGD